MYATVRRCEGIDKVRSEEVTRKVSDSLLPSLSEASAASRTGLPRSRRAPQMPRPR
jgi:hypothetical protein